MSGYFVLSPVSKPFCSPCVPSRLFKMASFSLSCTLAARLQGFMLVSCSFSAFQDGVPQLDPGPSVQQAQANCTHLDQIQLIFIHSLFRVNIGIRQFWCGFESLNFKVMWTSFFSLYKTSFKIQLCNNPLKNIRLSQVSSTDFDI